MLPVARDFSFLSCLGGSERRLSVTAGVRRFLSCLGGSEPLYRGDALALAFLSCLGGSELEYLDTFAGI